MIWEDYMKQTTIIFPIYDDQVLLGMKKRGFGEGKWNGFGGKLEWDEGFVENAQRELREEVWISLLWDQFQLKAIINFLFQEWDVIEIFTVSHVFTVPYNGWWQESDEMRPELFSLVNLPFDEMWEWDKLWIPQVVWEYNSVKKFDVIYDKNFNLLECNETS